MQCVLGKAGSLEVINAYEARYLYDEIWNHHAYSEGVPLTLPQGSVVIDCGANIGVFARYVFDRCPTATVVCVEPAPECTRILATNLEGYGNAHLVEIAISEESGFQNLCFYPGNSMMSSLYPDDEATRSLITTYTEDAIRDSELKNELMDVLPDLIQSRLKSEQVSVQTASLETILDSTIQVRDVELLKLDVEGSEVHALRGLGKYANRIRRVAVEVDTVERCGEVISILADLHMDTSIWCVPGYERTQTRIITGTRR